MACSQNKEHTFLYLCRNIYSKVKIGHLAHLSSFIIAEGGQNDGLEELFRLYFCLALDPAIVKDLRLGS